LSAVYYIVGFAVAVWGGIGLACVFSSRGDDTFDPPPRRYFH
jgi:hypothetical protein